MTPDAFRALGAKREVALTQFPCKIGRESRWASVEPRSIVTELRLGVAPQLNNLYLLEPPSADLLFVSREHFLIDYQRGSFVAVDRGSMCGTVVAGSAIGGDRRGGSAPLRDGDQIIVGTAESPYVFRFQITAA
jgi:hypothetical protein